MRGPGPANSSRVSAYSYTACFLVTFGEGEAR